MTITITITRRTIDFTKVLHQLVGDVIAALLHGNNAARNRNGRTERR